MKPAQKAPVRMDKRVRNIDNALWTRMVRSAQLQGKDVRRWLEEAIAEKLEREKNQS